MRFLKKSIYRKRRAPRKRSAVGKKGSSVSVAVKKYVNRTIHKNVENKIKVLSGGFNFGSVSGSPTMNVIPMLPYTGNMLIDQGVKQGQRIGNTIKVRSLRFNYVLRPAVYDVTVNPAPVPCDIQMLFGNVKADPGLLPNATDFQSLFQLGNTSSPPIGYLTDLIQPYNNDYWDIRKTCLHKIGYSSITGTGGTASTQYLANNDYKFNVVRKIDLTKQCPKTLKFDDTGTSISGRNLYFMIQGVAANGVTLASTSKPMSIDFEVILEYEDA